MKSSLVCTVAFSFGFLIASSTLAAPPSPTVSPSTEDHPCRKIMAACEAAGFTKGGAKDGKGLWVHCINPLAEGKAAKGSKLAMPTVDAGLIADCKAKHDMSDKRPLKADAPAPAETK